MGVAGLFIKTGGEPALTCHWAIVCQPLVSEKEVEIQKGTDTGGIHRLEL